MSANLLNFYSQLITEKEAEIKNLNQAKLKLSGFREELSGFRNYYFHPELSSQTWNGENSNEFTISRTALQESYEELKNDQYERVFSGIAAKISELQQEIKTYQSMMQSICSNMEKKEDL